MPARAVSSPIASTLHAHRRVGRHRAGHHAVAGSLAHRSRLTRDHRLVELGPTVHDRAVRRNAAARSDQHHVADRQRVQRHGADVVTVHHLGLVGQQLGQGGEGVAGLADRLHLLPVPEQHDRHQRGELPPELEVQQVEARGHRRDVRHRDGHRDEEHHPGAAVTNLSPTADQERPAAPPEHERPQHRPVPLHPRQGQLVTEPVHHHVAGDDEGHRQQQAEPEAATEHLRVVPGVLVMAAVRVVHPRRAYTSRG